MKNGVDYWCFSVIGKPLSKKRVRFAGRFSRFTDNEWYEHMIADAFKRAFPQSKPVGCEFYDVTQRKSKKKNGGYTNVYTLKKGYTRSDVPSVRPYFFFYFNSGTIGDADNYVKIVQDALNKIAYVDDFQVKVPTPYVIVDPYEVERVDVLIVPYNQHNDNHLRKLIHFVSNHIRTIDIYNEYEVERLKELTVNQLVNMLCPTECPKYYECFPRYKDDIIFCENRKK